MTRFAAVFITALLLAAGADAAWYPVFQPSYIQVRPGETVTANVSGGWLSGIMLVPFVPMTFVSEDPAIATVEGHLPTTETAPPGIHVRRRRTVDLRVLGADDIAARRRQ